MRVAQRPGRGFQSNNVHCNVHNTTVSATRVKLQIQPRGRANFTYVFMAGMSVDQLSRRAYMASQGLSDEYLSWTKYQKTAKRKCKGRGARGETAVVIVSRHRFSPSHGLLKW